jgi:hypothetical protein
VAEIDDNVSEMHLYSAINHLQAYPPPLIIPKSTKKKLNASLRNYLEVHYKHNYYIDRCQSMVV